MANDGKKKEKADANKISELREEEEENKMAASNASKSKEEEAKEVSSRSSRNENIKKRKPTSSGGKDPRYVLFPGSYIEVGANIFSESYVAKVHNYDRSNRTAAVELLYRPCNELHIFSELDDDIDIDIRLSLKHPRLVLSAPLCKDDDGNPILDEVPTYRILGRCWVISINLDTDLDELEEKVSRHEQTDNLNIYYCPTFLAYDSQKHKLIHVPPADDQ